MGRIKPRMRVDLVLMSSQIAGFLSLRSEGERRQRLFDSLPNPTVRFASAGGNAGGAEGEARGFIATDINPAFRSHFGGKAGSVLGARAGDLGRLVSIPDMDGIMAEVERSLVPRIIELDLKRSFLAATISRVDEGELIVTVEDISIRKKHEQELATAACHDALTGLLNRRVFMEMLGREIAGMKREGGEGSLLFLDLNHFKEVNDTMGHEAGDRLLKHVAATLASLLRESDTLARLGGDEFLVFCRKAGREQAPAIADKIASRLAASPLEIGGSRITVTTSIGIATYPGSATGAEDLVSAADQAMYEAKRAGLAYRLS
jgi:diguanylate cyclase (GGDEF)-like protein